MKEKLYTDSVDNSHEYLINLEIFIIVIHRQNDE